MKTTQEEIGFLNHHFNELNKQIGILAAKQATAETVCRQLANELHLLREVQRCAMQQLHSIELHQSGLYMWENIGEGG